MGNFIVPREIYHGPGSLEKIKEVRGKKAAIVVGKGSMQKHGHLERTKNYLKEAGIESFVFEGVEPDPSFETVMKGTELLNRENPDIIIGLGGCSAIDAAKAMWIFYEYPEATPENIIPPFSIKPLRNKATFVAIPSTSGTGTEVTCVSVITDREKGIKYPLVSYEITPDIAIVDGELCKSMSPLVTANTGLDALAHNVEAFVATLATNYSDALAVQSVKMIFESLPKAYRNPKDIDCRQAMHDASCMAGMAFTNAILGIVHSMAHQLGGMFGIPHGCANAILLPNVIRYNSKSTDKYTDLARLVGKSSAEDFASKIENLRGSIDVPSSIREYGIYEENFMVKIDEISQNAFNDPCTGTNPRVPTIEEIKKIFLACFSGEKIDF